MRYVSLDPGGTTGWCVADDDEIVQYGEITSVNHHSTLWHFLGAYNPDVLIVEKFINRRKQAVDLISRDYSGVAELYTQLNDCVLWYQRPDEALVLWDDDKVKALGLWQPGKPHACDAIRHMLNYIVVVRQEGRHYLETLR